MGAQLTVAHLTDPDDLRRLVPEWDALADAVGASPFCTPAWMATWWERIGAHTRGNALWVVTARDPDGRLVGLLPLYRSVKRAPLRRRVLRLLGTGSVAPDHLDAVVGGPDAERVVGAMLEHLGRHARDWDALDLHDLAEGSALLGTLPAWANTHRFRWRVAADEVCPFVRTVGSPEAYLAAFSHDHRHNLRRARRRLLDEHGAELEVATRPEAVSRALEEVIQLHARRWHAKHRPSAFDQPPILAFHREAAVRLAEQGRARVFVIREDGEALAACYCLHSPGSLAIYQHGFDPERANLHAAKVLIHLAIEHCFSVGIGEFDFLRGSEPYKFEWRPDVRHTWRTMVGSTWRGRWWMGRCWASGRVRRALTDARHAAMGSAAMRA